MRPCLETCLVIRSWIWPNPAIPGNNNNNNKNERENLVRTLIGQTTKRLKRNGYLLIDDVKRAITQQQHRALVRWCEWTDYPTLENIGVVYSTKSHKWKKRRSNIKTSSIVFCRLRRVLSSDKSFQRKRMKTAPRREVCWIIIRFDLYLFLLGFFFLCVSFSRPSNSSTSTSTRNNNNSSTTITTNNINTTTTTTTNNNNHAHLVLFGNIFVRVG